MICQICESGNTNTQLVDYEMTELGTDSVLLRNTPKVICHDCGEETFEIPNYNAVIKQIREKMCLINRVLNGGEFLSLRLGLEMTGIGCAKAMGVTNVTVSRWENGTSPVSEPADRLIRTWTLGYFGYSTTKIIGLLSALPEDGIEKVEVDLSNFYGTAFCYESCQRFGDGDGSRAWMLVNADV
jgi:YgiT-type zinc finger domain-containing protein